MRAVVFAAVSTTSQAAEDRYSLPQQLEACRGVAASFGWDVVKEIEVRGHSRRYRWLFELTADCPEYGELVDLVRGERTDIIVVRDYDRLWRTDSLRGQLCALCEEHHVQIFSVNQPTQVETPAALRNGVKNVAAHWLQAVLGIVSEGENELRIVRLRAGRAGRIAAGKQCTGTAPFGYRLTGIPGDVMQVNPDEAPWVRWMFEQIAEGATYPSIAATLNTRGVPTAGATRHGWATVWTRQTVRAICANSHYVGMVHLGKHEAQGQHEALIDRQLWDAVQVVRRSAGAGLPASPRRWDHILRGVVVCGYCGAAMHYRVAPTRYQLVDGTIKDRVYRSYVCRTHVLTGKTVCRANSQRAAPVRDYVLREVRRVLAGAASVMEHEAAAAMTAAQARTAEQIAALNNQAASHTAAWQRWNGLFESGGISADELLEHRARIEGHRSRLAAESARLEAEAVQQREFQSRRAEFAEMADQIDSLPDGKLHMIVRALVREVRLYDGTEPEIVFWGWDEVPPKPDATHPIRDAMQPYPTNA